MTYTSTFHIGFTIFCVLMLVSAQLTAAAQDGAKALEEVVVKAKRPGPTLWRIAHDGHDLYVFGIISPIPRDFVWDSESTEHIIGQAGAFLTPPEIRSGTLNPFKIISAIRKYNRMKQLPKDQTYQSLLTHEDWQKLKDLKASIGLTDKNLTLRPIMLVGQIISQGIDSQGLGDNRRLVKKLHKLAKSHKVNIIESGGELHINDAIALLDNVDEAQELTCLTETLHSANRYLQTVRRRAHNWANGEISKEMEANTASVMDTCFEAIITTAAAQKLQKETEEKWLINAQRAIESHQVSFAYLPLEEVVTEYGLFAQLKGRLSHHKK